DLPQLQGFERLHRELASLLAVRVRSLLAGEPTVQAAQAFTDQTTYGEFVLSLSAGTQAYRYAVEGIGGDVVLALGPRLVEVLLAPGEAEPEARVQHLGEGLARDLEAVWNPVTPLSVTQVEPHSDPWAIEVSPMFEVCALTAIEVTADRPEGELSGLVEACYPVSAIYGVLDRLPAAP
ncbi:hypothetical protein ACFL6X_07630, partial [Candidatus Latescibacterota bacterium]